MILVWSGLEMGQWLWDLFVEIFPLTYMLYNFVPLFGSIPYSMYHVDFSRLYAYSMLGNITTAQSNLACAGFNIKETTTA